MSLHKKPPREKYYQLSRDIFDTSDIISAPPEVAYGPQLSATFQGI